MASTWATWSASARRVTTAAIAAEEGVKTSDMELDAKAKQVVMGAIDPFTTMGLGLTDEDSPATISMDDARFAEFFDALKGYTV